MTGAKEGEVYVVPQNEGGGGWGMSGVFCRDTVLFDRWDWELGGAHFLSRNASGNIICEHHAITQEDRSQAVGLERELVVRTNGFSDHWTLVNSTAAARTVSLTLTARPRMVDLFATRLNEDDGAGVVESRISDTARGYHRTAADGVVECTTISCQDGLPDDLVWTLTLAAGARHTLEIVAEVERSGDGVDSALPLPSYDEWRTSFAGLGDADLAVAQAIDDLRALLLATAHGPYPAAGMPVFVNFFGRDALITGLMILDWRPDILRTVLAFLAERRGTTVDPFREEEPGKILHEIRRGELSRTGRIPFGRYYGSVDATPLFLMAAGEYLEAHPDTAFAQQLLPAIEAATDWLMQHLEGPSGLATFEASGSGLAVQSWKDSANSMVDEHGKSARQPLAVAEVQGFAYAALLAAARLLPARFDALTTRANTLKVSFHARYWLPELGTYAMALDADMKPLRVLSSDPGQLLWTGIVPAETAPALVETMLQPALWSGWGVRTLGCNEVAYNPVSYHNGSVWPHDTGLFAMGLARYGFERELAIVAQALIDMAAASPGRHAPELISGFARGGRADPVAYTHANAPQAWSAAAVIRMAAYLQRSAGQSTRENVA